MQEIIDRAAALLNYKGDKKFIRAAQRPQDPYGTFFLWNTLGMSYGLYDTLTDKFIGGNGNVTARGW